MEASATEKEGSAAMLRPSHLTPPTLALPTLGLALAVALPLGMAVPVLALAQDASQEVGVPLQAAPGADTAPGQALVPADQIVWHGDELLGRDIRTPAGDRLGQVDDFVIDPQSGVVHVLVDVGGLLGIGERRVAMGLRELAMDTEGTLIAQMTQSELEARQQYRHAESPMTGGVRPGSEVPQTAAGIGDPGQGSQFLPDPDPDAVGEPAPHQQPATRAETGAPGAVIQDDPLAQALRGDGSPLIDADPADREASLAAAADSINQLGEALQGADLDEDARARLESLHEEVTLRFRAAADSSPEAWPTTLRNLNVALGRLYQQTEVALATHDGPQTSGQGPTD